MQSTRRTRRAVGRGPAIVLALAVATPALAQDSVTAPSAPDLEDRDPTVQITGNSKLVVRGAFETEWHQSNNLDFRPIDDSSDQAILDSDDAMGFAFTGASLDLAYLVRDDLRFSVGATHRGLWGGDQIGTINRFGGFLYFTALNVAWSPSIGSWTPRIVIGRQFQDLGLVGRSRDYVYRDIVDQIRIDLPLGDVGTLITVPVQIVSETSEFDNADFVSYLGDSAGGGYNFDGDHMTRRHGAILELDGLPIPVDAAAYVFYTDIGGFARGTGADISYNGRLGNFADNDWVLNAGVRAQAPLADGAVTPFVTFDLSSGIDRKQAVAPDVDTNGWALGLGVVVDTRDDDGGGLEAEASMFQALGPAYDGSGMQYSHGYVGMKGQHVGGLLTNRYYGMHPASYVGMFGITDRPQDSSRVSGARVIHARAGYTLENGLGLSAGWWLLQDTSVTFLDMADLERIDPPYGYSRDEFAAEERLGKTLGQELDLNLSMVVNENLAFRAIGGMFLPGAYYAIPVSREAGNGEYTALGGDKTGWGLTGGVQVRF